MKEKTMRDKLAAAVKEAQESAKRPNPNAVVKDEKLKAKGRAVRGR